MLKDKKRRWPIAIASGSILLLLSGAWFYGDNGPYHESDNQKCEYPNESKHLPDLDTQACNPPRIHSGGGHEPYPGTERKSIFWKQTMLTIDKNFGYLFAIEPESRERIAAFFSRYASGKHRGELEAHHNDGDVLPPEDVAECIALSALPTIMQGHGTIRLVRE